MRCASERKNFDELPDFFGPKELGRLLGVGQIRAYELAKSEGFPAMRIGKKLIISKAGLARWQEQIQNKRS